MLVAEPYPTISRCHFSWSTRLFPENFKHHHTVGKKFPNPQFSFLQCQYSTHTNWFHARLQQVDISVQILNLFKLENYISMSPIFAWRLTCKNAFTVYSILLHTMNTILNYIQCYTVPTTVTVCEVVYNHFKNG